MEIALSICALPLRRTIMPIKSVSKVGHYALRRAPNFMKLTPGYKNFVTLHCTEIHQVKQPHFLLILYLAILLLHFPPFLCPKIFSTIQQVIDLTLEIIQADATINIHKTV